MDDAKALLSLLVGLLIASLIFYGLVFAGCVALFLFKAGALKVPKTISDTLDFNVGDAIFWSAKLAGGIVLIGLPACLFFSFYLKTPEGDLGTLLMHAYFSKYGAESCNWAAIKTTTMTEFRRNGYISDWCALRTGLNVFFLDGLKFLFPTFALLYFRCARAQYVFARKQGAVGANYWASISPAVIGLVSYGVALYGPDLLSEINQNGLAGGFTVLAKTLLEDILAPISLGHALISGNTQELYFYAIEKVVAAGVGFYSLASLYPKVFLVAVIFYSIPVSVSVGAGD